MSKNNNVNPDHYKTRGREPQGQGVAHEVQKQEFARIEKLERKRTPKPKDKAKKA